MHVYIFIFIFIFICKCVCVCVCEGIKKEDGWKIKKATKKTTSAMSSTLGGFYQCQLPNVKRKPNSKRKKKKKKKKKKKRESERERKNLNEIPSIFFFLPPPLPVLPPLLIFLHLLCLHFHSRGRTERV